MSEWCAVAFLLAIVVFWHNRDAAAQAYAEAYSTLSELLSSLKLAVFIATNKLILLLALAGLGTLWRVNCIRFTGHIMPNEAQMDDQPLCSPATDQSWVPDEQQLIAVQQKYKTEINVPRADVIVDRLDNIKVLCDLKKAIDEKVRRLAGPGRGSK